MEEDEDQIGEETFDNFLIFQKKDGSKELIF